MASARHEHHGSAWDSLWRIARLEGRDIVTVFWFALGVSALAVLAPLGVEQAVNAVQFGGLIQPLLVVSGLLFGAFAAAGAFLALQHYVVEAMQQRLFARLALRIGARLPNAAGSAAHLPATVNRFLEVATAQKAFASLLVDALALALNTIVGMLVLAFYHPYLLGFDLALALALGLVLFVLGRGAADTAVAESHAKYDLAAWLEELARPTAAFKPAPAAAAGLARVDALAAHYLEHRNAHYRVWRKQLWFALGLQALATAGLLALGGWLVATGSLTVGQLVAAYLIVSVVVGSFAKFAKHLQTVYDLAAASDKLCHLLDLPQEPAGGAAALPAGPWPVRVRGLELHAEGRRIFGPFEGVADAGSSVALAGPSGAGATTLLEALFGLRVPAAGRIEFAEMDLRELPLAAARARIGWAGSAEAIHGTLLENVTVGRADIDPQSALDALAAAELLDEARSLPDGLETVVTPDARPLTGTQAAKLQLARAFAARPALLLVDGLFDMLPDESRRRIAARALSPGNPWTAVVATRRPEVAELCGATWNLPGPAAPEGAGR